MNRRQFLQTAGAPVLARAASRRPNILFFFPDQHRFDWTGFNTRLPVRTPHLEALAQRGVRFDKAIVASPVCAPSRACLASGMEYERCGVPSNAVDYPNEKPTFYQALRRAGYQVMGCGKFDLHKASADWGVDGQHGLREWGFTLGIDNAGKFDAIRSGAERPRDPYMAYLHQHGLAAAHVADFQRRAREGYKATYPTPLPDTAYCDNWIAQNGLNLLSQVPAGRPWFLQVNFAGPHNPMDVTRRMADAAPSRRFPQPHRCRVYTPEEHLAIRQNYSLMIENIDHWLGRYIDEIRKRGELDNTLIVFSSDHGEMLGDHTRWAKSVPYQQSIGVPLVIAGPGVKSGIASGALVSIIDLAATFLEYAGAPAPRDFDSRSLKALLEGRAKKHREYLRSGLSTWRLVWDGRYKLVRGFDPAGAKPGNDKVFQRSEGPDLLFDLEADPMEDENLAGRLPGEVRRLERLLG